MKVQSNLKVLLAENNKSLSDVASNTDISYQSLHKFISNKSRMISFKMIESICSYLNCQPGELFILK